MKFDSTEADLREAEKARRRWRYEQRLGSVHRRPNTKNRKREAQQSNTKRGNAWKRETFA